MSEWLAALRCARCGRPYGQHEGWAIAPGQEAVYAAAVDLFGADDPRLGRVLLSAPVPPSARHFPECPA